MRVILVVLMVMAACGDDMPAAVDAALDVAVDAPPTSGLTWTACGTNECATLQVPSDGIDAANGTVPMRLLRRRALDPARRIGALIWTVGGPGNSGVALGAAVLQDFSARVPDVAQRFDIVFYERRGSGGTLTCIGNAWVDAQRAAMPDPSTTQEWAAVDAVWQQFGSGCGAASTHLPAFSSETEARDIERLRVALGEQMISVFAVSGGTTAAASYATQFAAHLRAAVVDSPLPPPGATFSSLVADVAAAQEAALDAFFVDCGAMAGCAFHGGEGTTAVRAAYDALSASLETTPLSVSGRTAGRFDLDYAVQNIMARTGGEPGAVRGTLGSLLASAAAGNGAAMLAEADPWWYRTGTGYDVGLWSVSYAIPLGDQACPASFDVAAATAMWPALVAAQPRLGPSFYFQVLSCLHWPAPRTTPIAIGPSSSPVLVVAGMHDLNVGGVAAANRLAAALGSTARLVKRDGFGHVQLQNACIAASESAFLIDPATWTAPAGSTCN